MSGGIGNRGVRNGGRRGEGPEGIKQGEDGTALGVEGAVGGPGVGDGAGAGGAVGPQRGGEDVGPEEGAVCVARGRGGERQAALQLEVGHGGVVCDGVGRQQEDAERGLGDVAFGADVGEAADEEEHLADVVGRGARGRVVVQEGGGGLALEGGEVGVDAPALGGELEVLDVLGGNLPGADGRDAGDGDRDAAAGAALSGLEDTFDAVERAAHDAHAVPLGHRIRLHLVEALVVLVGAGHDDEALHLGVGDGDASGELGHAVGIARRVYI